MKNLTLLIFVSLFLAQCYPVDYASSSYSAGPSRGDTPPNAKPGECYAKCMTPAKQEIIVESYFVYTGDSTKENVTLERKKIEIKPATKKWEKRIADKNCVSDNPEDCKVWVQVESPAEYAVLNTVKDTSQTTNYKVANIERIRVVEKSTFSEWRQVLCPSQVTSEVKQQLSSALKAKGFYKDEPTKEFSENIKKALIDFQEANDLPVGHLDVETLNALGINY